MSSPRSIRRRSGGGRRSEPAEKKHRSFSRSVLGRLQIRFSCSGLGNDVGCRVSYRQEGERSEKDAFS